ncbi:hypothetical protein SAMN03159489_01650 [Pseudomonas sp. NFPP07]|uniref:hypothetical protein n=1 Tax=Pseudomonas sp. NFPP07 TaxID=1566213 RepID=UPI0008DF41B3|nr:hypothetical protein [Pseudomonas sp. NFPP07]SFP77088.1 hypothetical protein SAMN03159489_01650 [Pseudomonas sp. NFPP07]
MKGTSKYPWLKVLLGILLCPLIGGVVGGLVMMVVTIYQMASNPRIIGEMGGAGAFGALISGPFVAQLLFAIPALLLALLVVWRQLYKNRSGLVQTALAGGLLGGGWMLTVVSLLDKQWGLEHFGWSLAAFAGCFLTALVAAALVLPWEEEPPISSSVDENGNS